MRAYDRALDVHLFIQADGKESSKETMGMNSTIRVQAYSRVQARRLKNENEKNNRVGQLRRRGLIVDCTYRRQKAYERIIDGASFHYKNQQESTADSTSCTKQDCTADDDEYGNPATRGE